MAAVDGERAAEIRIETSVDAAGVPTMRISGELDSSNSASLEQAVATLIATSPARLIFDLTDLRFMDSAGIAVLIGASTKTSVALRNPTRIVRRVVEVTGLTGVLPIES